MNWLVILLVPGAAQGFLMTEALLHSSYTRNSANRYLAAWLLLISLRVLGRVIAESNRVVQIPNNLSLSVSGSLMILEVRIAEKGRKVVRYYNFERLFEEKPVISC